MTTQDSRGQGTDAPVTGVALNDPDRVRRLIADYHREHGEAPAAAEPRGSAEASPHAEGTPFDLVVKGRRVAGEGGFAAREIGIRDGRIAAIEPLGAALQAREVVELADDETLLPGLVDTHVHINEPGRTEWEGFATATRAAAAGGVTTVLDMPLNSIPSTVNPPALEYKQLFAQQGAFVDIGFWGGAIPGNLPQLRPLHDAGVFGFKCFLLHSGVDEFPPLTAEELGEALTETSSFGSLMIVHAEDAETIDSAPQAAGNTYGSFLQSRPRDAENLAISSVIERTRATGGRTHILHLSSSDALDMIAGAKREGLDLTVETCPHYLTLSAEEIPDGATAFKCCPPVREEDNREQLWQGLLEGTIDFIVSDHSPSTLELKNPSDGDFAVAWGGVSSLQLGLSLIWTEARRRGIELERVVRWMSSAPAERVGLTSKGQLAIGFDADLAVFAAEETFVVDAGQLHHRHPITPYQGKTLQGRVRATYLRGQRVEFDAPTGQLLRHEQA
ncbi:allantoinase AllB [Brachybacterium vulturis]|uniref:allantoinase n=1 Tax=Brachybacterium vulturis TaxID=2017484 RepID=A0A291GQJ9_9MICO|nr:allantoinase AllB [Brachybacterium vulturis]ATG52753.1 allantoinase AllB [Brachybacterium vulturis]